MSRPSSASSACGAAARLRPSRSAAGSSPKMGERPQQAVTWPIPERLPRSYLRQISRLRAKEDGMSRLSKVVGVTLTVSVAVAVWAVAAGTAAHLDKWGADAATPAPRQTQAAIAPELAAAREATAKYVNNLALAKKDGY